MGEKTVNDKPNTHLSVQVPTDLKAVLRKLAYKKNVKLSDIVRIILAREALRQDRDI